MTKIKFLSDSIALTNKYRKGTLPSGLYYFHLGTTQCGYLTNKADAVIQCGIETAPQYIKSLTGTLFMGSLRILTILEKIPENRRPFE